MCQTAKILVTVLYLKLATILTVFQKIVVEPEPYAVAKNLQIPFTHLAPAGQKRWRAKGRQKRPSQR